MNSQEKELRKQNHQKNMRLLAALAVEHGLRFLPSGDKFRTLIEADIAVLRSGDESAPQGSPKSGQ